MATAYKLCYFPIAGRAFPIRVAFGAAGIPLEDERIAFPELAVRKADPAFDLPLKQLPVLQIDGKAYCQSLALSRFAAKKGGLYPTDDLKALAVDEFCDSINECMGSIPSGAGVEAEELKVKREAWVVKAIAHYLPFFERRLKESGGPFVLGSDLTMADLWLSVLASMLSAGVFDHVPKTILETFPLITANAAATAAHPVVIAHGK